MSAKKRLLEDMIRPIIEGLGFECWGIELVSQGKHSVLRVFIESLDNIEHKSASSLNDEAEAVGDIILSDDLVDKEGGAKESGVSLKNCEQVSRQLSGVLDVEDPIKGDYTLEVSSPGMDRPLYQLSHFERFIGYQIALKLRMPFEGSRKYKGILKGVEGNDIILQVENEEFLFPHEGIEKANVIPQFD